MELNGSELIAKVLKSHGVEYVCILCGTSISPAIVAFNDIGIKIVDTRHEATALYAAKASARITGIPGVVVVTSGPGLTNTVTASACASFDEVPVIILSGAVPTIGRNIGFVQDMDQLGLMKPVCKATLSIERKNQVVSVMKEAFQIACSDVPGPVYVQLPSDILENNYKLPLLPFLRNETEYSPSDQDEKSSTTVIVDSGNGSGSKYDFTPLPITYPKGSTDDITASAQIISTGSKPLLILGSPAIARPKKIEKLMSVMKQLEIPTYLIYGAKGLLGKKHKYLLTKDVLMKKSLTQTDVVILAGVYCDWQKLTFGTELPKNGAKIISVNRSRKLATINDGKFWTSSQIVESDVAYYLSKLSKALQKSKYSSSESWITSLRQKEDEYEAYLQKRTQEKSNIYLNPLKILSTLEASLGEEDAIWVFDEGDFVNTANYFLNPSSPLSWFEAGPFAGVGGSIGYAIGTKLAKPDREVYAVVGDGSCGYTIMEFDTLKRHKIHILVVTGNDGEWTEVGRKQEETYGNIVGCKLDFTHYEQIAKTLGAKAFFIDSKNENDLSRIFKKARTFLYNKSVFINVLMGKTDIRKGYS